MSNTRDDCETPKRKLFRVRYGKVAYTPGYSYYVEVLDNESFFWLPLGDGWFTTAYPSEELARQDAIAIGFKEWSPNHMPASQVMAFVWIVLLIILALLMPFVM